MILVKLLYLVLLIILACFWILYVDSIALIMLLCALCLPILLKTLMICLKFKSEAFLSCDANTCTSGDSIPVTVTINNRLPFSFSQMHAVIDLHHSFGIEKERIKLQFPLHAKNTTKMTFYIHTDFCGTLDISLKKLYVLDYLHLFRANLIASRRTASVLIVPKRIQLQVFNLSEPVYCDESDLFGDKAGDDPSEIFGLHEYIPGDSVSRIHWKLSSKNDQMLVKEFSTPVLKSVMLIADFKWDNISTKHRMREVEAFLSVFYSLVCTMVEQQIVPTVLWYRSKSDEMYHCTPTTLSDIIEMFRELFFSIASMEMDVQLLLNETVGTQYSSVTCLTNVLTERLLTAIDRQIDVNQRNIVLINSTKQENAFLLENSTLISTTPDRISTDIEQLVI